MKKCLQPLNLTAEKRAALLISAAIKCNDAERLALHMVKGKGNAMIIIGEKINGAIPSAAEAIARRDEEFIRDLARRQTEAGPIIWTSAPAQAWTRSWTLWAG